MNIIDARKMNAEEIAALLKKKAFDETELSPGVQAACDQMWGEHLTAAQIVDRIVDYVRRVGDEALLYFTNTIDRADLTAETLRVTEREFDEARTLVDPKVVDSMTRAIMNVKNSTRSRCLNPGLPTGPMAAFWDRRSRPWTVWVFMCPAVRRPILPA